MFRGAHLGGAVACSPDPAPPPGVPGWGCMPPHVNGEALPSLLPLLSFAPWLGQACVSAARAAIGRQGTFQPICMLPC